MKRLLLTFAFLLLAAPSWAAIVCGNETSVSVFGPADPQTLAWTPDAGSNRVAIVVVHYTDTDADNTTATLSSSAGGTWTEYAFVNEEAGDPDLVTYIFYSTDFADGAQTLSVNYSTAAVRGGIAAYTCTGVRVSNPWRGTATTGSANNASTTQSIAVPSAVGDLVIDAVTVASPGAGEAPAVGAGQTEMYNLTYGSDSLDASGSTEPGAAGNVTMSWTTAANERWSQAGGSLVPAPGPQSPIFFE